MSDAKLQGTFQLGTQYDQSFSRPGQWSGQLAVGLQVSDWHLLQRPLFGFLNVQDPQFALQMSVPASLSAQIAWTWWKHSWPDIGKSLDLSMQTQVQRQQGASPAQSQWMVQFLQGQLQYNFRNSNLSMLMQINVYHTWNDDSSHYFGAQGIAALQLTWDLKK
jgi:hypothetical protein